MNSIVNQRFKKCLAELKRTNVVRSNRQFALKLDYLPQSLSEIIQGRRSVSSSLICKAVEVFKFNPTFLYTGEGELLMDAIETVKDGMRLLTIVTDDNNDEKIVHVPMKAQAGYANNLSDPEFVGELPIYSLPDERFKQGTYRSFEVKGDSMEPTLNECDKIICRYIQPHNWEMLLRDNYVYVIITHDNVLVKRITNNMRTQRSLLLHSDNSFYDSFSVNADEIRELWFVEYKLTSFLPSPQNIERSLLNHLNELRKTISSQNELIDTLKDSIDMIGQLN